MNEHNRQHGFTTVEILVGVVIGLLVCLTALSTFTFMETQKRSTMGRNGALSNGGLALFQIENEAKHAGLGLMTTSAFVCSTANLGYKGTVLLNKSPLYPVLITDGGTGSDSIKFAYLNSLSGATTIKIAKDMDSASGTIYTNVDPNTSSGNLLLLRESGYPCTFRQVSSVAASGSGYAVTHTSGDYNVSTSSFTQPITYVSGDYVAFTSGLTWVKYDVSNGTLRETDNITGTTRTIADSVVGMKAYYGVSDASTSSAKSISSWQSPSSFTVSDTNLLKVRAIRVGVALRSPERDNSCPGTSSTLTLWDSGPTIDISGVTDWKCYKFQTYSMIIPLFNVTSGIR